MSSSGNEIHKDIEVLLFVERGELHEWLLEHVHDEQAYWFKIAKKASKETSVTYEEAREEALMFGWIDGLINKYDEDFYLIRFSHRRPKSIWSKINVGIVEQLIEKDMLQPEGKKEAEAAQSDGRWDAAY